MKFHEIHFWFGIGEMKMSDNNLKKKMKEENGFFELENA